MEQIVYLVDDDDDDCFLAQQAINPHLNCVLKIFYNGQELIDFLTAHPTVPPPTLILLDLNMPLLDGFETLAVLKSHPAWSQIPVVVLTTSSDVADRDKANQLGAEGFLTKPANYQTLSQVLASVSNCWRKMFSTPQG
ncbi:response regulator [Nibrella saemangeumensis]|uniref:Response regulator n=1 Tax=Nibrella saemangeumensis TaxID=1084526 RepID=A0ABP8MM32_9BACT